MNGVVTCPARLCLWCRIETGWEGETSFLRSWEGNLAVPATEPRQDIKDEDHTLDDDSNNECFTRSDCAIARRAQPALDGVIGSTSWRLQQHQHAAIGSVSELPRRLLIGPDTLERDTALQPSRMDFFASRGSRPGAGTVFSFEPATVS